MIILAINCSSQSFIDLFNVIASFVRILYVLVLLALIVFGMLDFAKAMISDKGDNSVAVKTFMKRLANTVIVFLVIPIVMFILGIVNSGVDSNSTVSTCTDVIVNGLLDKNSIPSADNNGETFDQFESKCVNDGGVYAKISVDLYHDDLTNVVDTYRDDSFVYICTRGDL